MHSILQRLIYGWAIILFACVGLGVGLLLTIENPTWIPKWRAILGLILFTAVAVAALGLKDKLLDKDAEFLVIAVIGVVLLILVDSFFHGKHPMHRYAGVRQVTPDGFVETDEIFLRTAPVVRMLEEHGSRKSEDEGWFGIERYMYSVRFGLLLGRSLGYGEGEIVMDYEDYGLPAWLLGIRAVCEEFTFFAINLSPILLGYGIYCEYKKKPPKYSLAIKPVRSLFMLAPFCLGSFPIP